MITNNIIFDFIINNFLLLVIFILFIIRIIPPQWAGFWKYNNNQEADGKANKISFLRFILHSLVESIFGAVLIPLLAGFGLKNMVTFIIFIVVIFDVFIRNQISGGAVTLVGIGIVVLYLDRLIETGKHIKLFGGLLIWDKDEKLKDAESSIPKGNN